MLNNNVVVTTGDMMGGRINNRIREPEMFVIIPSGQAIGEINIFAKNPGANAIYEATRPEGLLTGNAGWSMPNNGVLNTSPLQLCRPRHSELEGQVSEAGHS